MSKPFRHRAIDAVAVGLLLLLASYLALRLAPRFAYPYPIEESDGGMLASAWHVATEGPVYNPAERAPYILNIHNPLVIYLSALLMRLAGPSPLWPRLLCEGMLLGGMAFLFLTARGVGASTAGALIAALLPPVNRYVLMREGLAICDFGAVFFQMMGLYFWVRGGRLRYAAVVSFVLAYFSKQSAIFVPAASFAALFLEGKRLKAAWPALLYVPVLGAGLALAFSFWGEAYFLNTFFYGTVRDFSSARGAAAIGFAFLYHPLFFAAAAWSARPSRMSGARALVPALVCAGIIHAFLMGNDGASPSYIFDLVIALALAAGVCWSPFVSWIAAGRGFLRAAAVAALLAQTGLVATGALYKSERRTFDLRRHRERDSLRAPLFERPGMVLCGTPGYATGRAATDFSTDPHTVGRLIEGGLLPADTVVSLVRTGAFSGIVVPRGVDRTGLFTTEVLDAISETYGLAGRKGTDLIFVLEQETPAGKEGR